jgi:prepilin-type N-terminal cleavage/methylation domain-containing protein
MVSLLKLRQSDNQGFSIVEIIIVMLIMSVVMMAVMSLFIPAKRASIVQSDLATVQGGMRVVLERMSKDFRNAGFLYNAGSPVTSAGYPVNTVVDETVVVDASVNPLSINTRAVSGVFGRIAAIPATPADSFTLIYPEQFINFPVGAYAAVAEPVNGTLLGDATANPGVPLNIYRVLSSSSGLVRLGNLDGSSLSTVAPFSGAVAGLVLLRAPDAAATAANAAAVDAALNRTVTYGHVDTNGDGVADTLTRQIDAGSVSYMANGISGVNFTIQEDADGDVTRVTIELVGETVETGQDAVGRAKTKRMSTMISLRNI